MVEETREPPKLTAPRVHLNGTGRSALERQYEAALEALSKAIDALGETSPNARDYYVIEPGAFSRAMGEHAARVRSLRDVQGQLYWLREALDEGENVGAR
jgi:hypothetical protein